MFGYRTVLNKPTSALLAFSIAIAGSVLVAPNVVADTLKGNQVEDKGAAKDANVAEAERLNGTSEDAGSVTKASKDNAVKIAKKQANQANRSDNEARKDGSVQPAPDQAKNGSKATANVVNQVPGVKVKESDLEPPAQPPIKGFHPIKRLLRPVENLEGMSIKLEQQIMKLEGPIAALQPPMISLQGKMTKVDTNLGQVHGQLNSMQGEMTGVRSDIAGMRKDINDLKQPIVSLKDPIGSVAKPLERVQTLLGLVLAALLIMAIAIPVGTPIAAILIYKNRRRLFPDMSEHDMPKVVAAKDSPKEPVGVGKP